MSRGGVRQWGEWAVVTGASSGIGREIARCLAGEGLRVVLTARGDAALEALAAEIAAMGSQALVVPLDLSQRDGARKLEEATRELDIGILVNCAGFGSGGAFLESDREEAAAMVDLNCLAVLELSHRFGQRFARRKRGAIVLLSSLVGFQGVPRSANYAATKAYVQSLGEALAEELRPEGVHVLTAIPGPTLSGFGARAGMTMGMADTAVAVARDIVKALGAKRSRVVPGRVGKLLLYSLLTAPRFVRVLLMKRIMGAMTA